MHDRSVSLSPHHHPGCNLDRLICHVVLRVFNCLVNIHPNHHINKYQRRSHRNQHFVEFANVRVVFHEGVEDCHGDDGDDYDEDAGDQELDEDLLGGEGDVHAGLRSRYTR